MINKRNIEEKLFEYFEGTLGAAEKKSVEDFVQENPEFQADFDAWKLSYLPEENFRYKYVDDLLKPESSDGKAFFGRWKTSLLLMLVGVGMSAGAFYTLHFKSVKTNDSFLQTITNKTANNTANKSESVVSLENKEDQFNKNLGAVHKDKALKQKDSTNKTSKQSKTPNSGHFSNKIKENIPQEITTIENFKQTNKGFKKTVAGLSVSNLDDFRSTPNLSSAKNKLQDYDKNIVKFNNNKDPLVNIPNTLALEMNSSIAGNKKGLRLNYQYAIQWPEINDYYNTHSVSVDGYVRVLRGGLALIAINDVMGHNKFVNNSLGVVYAPKFSLGSKTSIEPSVKYSYTQKSISWNQLKTNELIDPRAGLLNVVVENQPDDISKSKIAYSNLGLGLLINTSKLFLGFSYDGLLSPSYDFDGLSQEITVPSRFTAQVGGSVVPFKNFDNFTLSPAIYYVKVGTWDNLWFCNVLNLSKLFIGTSFSTNSDAYFTLGYNNENVKLSYNFGLAKPPINISNRLTLHQLGLVFVLKK